MHRRTHAFGNALGFALMPTGGSAQAPLLADEERNVSANARAWMTTADNTVGATMSDAAPAAAGSQGSGGRLILSSPDGSGEAIDSEALRRTDELLESLPAGTDPQPIFEEKLREVEAEVSADVVTRPYIDHGAGIVAIPLSDGTLGSSGIGLRPSTNDNIGLRFAQGAVGALKAVTVEPIRQTGDLLKAGASVVYNEFIRGDSDPYWLPQLNSDVAGAYSSGTSQARLLLQSNFLTGTGVLSYDATTAFREGRYGDVAEMAGGVAGGFAVGKVVQKYGGYGLTIDDIGATGPLASQRGAIGLRLTGPEDNIVVHKNSLDYVGETHVYRIIGPDGATYKIGESARGLRISDGLSIRAEQQVRALQRETGNFYKSEIIDTFSDKRSARQYETQLIERFRRIYGSDALPGNKTNR